eukprot:70440-Prymnesium_polylepis.1
MSPESVSGRYARPAVPLARDRCHTYSNDNGGLSCNIPATLHEEEEKKKKKKVLGCPGVGSLVRT